MVGKLWEKSSDIKIDKLIERFEVGEDYILDLELVDMDIIASLAHCIMLNSIGILSSDELEKIRIELKKLSEQNRAGEFTLGVSDEDVHSKIENILTTKLGSIGKKIHTGRSRNDQVLVDLRLYSKRQLLSLKARLLNLCDIFLSFAKRYEFLPMPGYTHMQLAMPSSLGMWSSSFVEAFLDEIRGLLYSYSLNDQCPLGSGAGYGVSLPLDRELTSKLLGFNRIQRNSLYCANSRGKIESNTISVLSSISSVLNKIASDILLFTTKEFNFFDVADEITTGSSIMPQKKNVDVLELVRAKHSSLLGFEFSIKSLISNLISGYNRDFQETKKYLLSSFFVIMDSIDIMIFVMKHIVPREERLIEANEGEIYATDYAYKLVVDKGMPFREAYVYAGNNLNKIEFKDKKGIVKNRKSLGSTGNLRLDDYKLEMDDFRSSLEFEERRFKDTLDALWCG